MRLKLTIRQRMAEACAICFVNTSLMFLAAMILGRCEQITTGNATGTGTSNYYKTETTRKFFCPHPDRPGPGDVGIAGYDDAYDYNDLATLCFNPLEEVTYHSLPPPATPAASERSQPLLRPLLRPLLHTLCDHLSARGLTGIFSLSLSLSTFSSPPSLWPAFR